MAGTLATRFIRALSPLHPQLSDGCNTGPSSHHDPADLAVALRALACRTHEAVKAYESRQRRLTGEELDDLRIEISWLENEFRAQNLPNLIAYVVALRYQVETKFA
jgi:hypothetical protein